MKYKGTSLRLQHLLFFFFITFQLRMLTFVLLVLHILHILVLISGVGWKLLLHHVVNVVIFECEV